MHELRVLIAENNSKNTGSCRKRSSMVGNNNINFFMAQYWLDNKQFKGNRNFLASKQVSLFTSTGAVPRLKLAVLEL